MSNTMLDAVQKKMVKKAFCHYIFPFRAVENQEQVINKHNKRKNTRFFLFRLFFVFSVAVLRLFY